MFRFLGVARGLRYLDTAPRGRLEVGGGSFAHPGRGSVPQITPRGEEGSTTREDATEILIQREDIDGRVRDLGRILSDEYEGRRPIFVGLLKGSLLFMADLVRAVTVDPEIDFMSISSYGNRTTTSGSVRVLRDLDRDIFDRDVVVVEDIVDSGLSLAYIQNTLLARKPRSLALVALLDKPDRRRTEVTANHVGFTIPDRFVVGYGLDYRQRYRGLPYIAILSPEEIGGTEEGV